MSPTTNSHYSLSKLFGQEHTKIVIPDLQRDYCWGGKQVAGRGLVQGFIESLIVNGFNQNKTALDLGVLYGYQGTDQHRQLCDGQQRITTLFLLLGVLNRRCVNQFKPLLISDFELNRDDKEPYLQYAIREHSLYFLSDLVCRFFLDPLSGSVDQIKQSAWYFNDYNNDPSIQSMLVALSEIEAVLDQYHPTIDYTEFGWYVAKDLSFLYYDLGSRKAGEEAFVIINTTGEPLSATENLKPRYATTYPECCVQWEEWERWFWRKRGDANDTADNGMLEFLRWVVLLETKEQKVVQQLQEQGSFDYKQLQAIAPQTIDNYFKIVKRLFEKALPDNHKWLSPTKEGNNQIVWFELLPLIAYLKRFPDASPIEIKRVEQLFKNLARVDNVRKAVGPLLPLAIQLIRNHCADLDIAQIVHVAEVSDRIITPEERLKFGIYLGAANRVEVEQLFWAAEQREIWQGEIQHLLDWSTTDGVFDFGRFQQLNQLFNQVFIGDCGAGIDLTRRALITMELKEYPKYLSSQTNKSFGWKWSDWKRLFAENPEKFRAFFDCLLGRDLEEAQNEMIANFADDKDWSEFAKIPELMAYCEQKNIQWWGEANGWVLVKRVNVRGPHANVNAYKLNLEYEKKPFWDPTYWRIWFYADEDTCVVFDNKARNIAVDIQCKAVNGLYELTMFCRDDQGNTQTEMQQYAEPFGLLFNGERYASTPLDQAAVTELITQITHRVL